VASWAHDLSLDGICNSALWSKDLAFSAAAALPQGTILRPRYFLDVTKESQGTIDGLRWGNPNGYRVSPKVPYSPYAFNSFCIFTWENDISSGKTIGVSRFSTQATRSSWCSTAGP